MLDRRINPPERRQALRDKTIHILNAKEVSLLLKVKLSTVYAWADQRIIPCYKLSGALRFSEEDIKDWLHVCKLHDEEYNSIAGKRPRKGGTI